MRCCYHRHDPEITVSTGSEPVGRTPPGRLWGGKHLPIRTNFYPGQYETYGGAQTNQLGHTATSLTSAGYARLSSSTPTSEASLEITSTQ